MINIKYKTRISFEGYSGSHSGISYCHHENEYIYLVPFSGFMKLCLEFLPLFTFIQVCLEVKARILFLLSFCTASSWGRRGGRRWGWRRLLLLLDRCCQHEVWLALSFGRCRDSRNWRVLRKFFLLGSSRLYHLRILWLVLDLAQCCYTNANHWKEKKIAFGWWYPLRTSPSTFTGSTILI